MTAQPQPAKNRSFPAAAVALIAVALCGFLLRLYALGKESIWVDEGFTWRLAKLTLPQYIDNVLHTTRNVLPPLYFQIMHYWTAFFGDSEFSMRLPSVIFGTLSIFGIYALGRRIFDKETGIAGALILAFSIFHIQYSQEARMYEMLSLLSIVSFLLLLKFIRDNKWSSAFLLGLANVLLIYTHHYGFFIVFSGYVFAALICLTRRGYLGNSITRWLALSVMTLLLVAPWLYVFINQARKVAKDPWLPAPTAKSLLSLFATYSGGTILLALFLFMAALWLFSRLVPLHKVFRKEEPLDGNGRLMLASWLFVPILCALAYSLAVGPIFGGKYLIASSIPFYCFAARAVSAVKWRYVGYGLLAIVGIISLLNARNYYNATNKEQWREAAAFVDKYAQANDLAIFNAGFGLENGFDYYSRRMDLVRKPFPERTVEVNTRVTEDDLAELSDVASGHRRVWVIYSHSHDSDDLIRSKLLESYSDPYGCKRFVGVRVCLYEKARK